MLVIEALFCRVAANEKNTIIDKVPRSPPPPAPISNPTEDVSVRTLKARASHSESTSPNTSSAAVIALLWTAIHPSGVNKTSATGTRLGSCTARSSFAKSVLPSGASAICHEAAANIPLTRVHEDSPMRRMAKLSSHLITSVHPKNAAQLSRTCRSLLLLDGSMPLRMEGERWGVGVGAQTAETEYLLVALLNRNSAHVASQPLSARSLLLDAS
mmetsp:Transcript_75151/g.125299  ORF Transcript_75151/g.125299 Transcript_75151/m.125299 type:complete len:214 (-) Transcript_75151:34-675(-)